MPVNADGIIEPQAEALTQRWEDKSQGIGYGLDMLGQNLPVAEEHDNPLWEIYKVRFRRIQNEAELENVLYKCKKRNLILYATIEKDFEQVVLFGTVADNRPGRFKFSDALLYSASLYMLGKVKNKVLLNFWEAEQDKRGWWARWWGSWWAK